MSLTRIAVRSSAQGSGQSTAQFRTELVVGKLAPRLISRGQNSAHVGVTAAEMLLLDGDQVEIQVRVGAGCTLLIEDIGGTVAYPRRISSAAGPPAQWNVDIKLEAGACLLWKGLPFVVAQTAEVVRCTSARLGPGAQLLLRETLVLGRHGETGGAIRSSLNISDDSGPLLCEETLVNGALPEPGVLGDERVLDSVIAAGFRPETAPGELVLEGPGAVARFLGHACHESGLAQTWERWETEMSAS